MYYLIGIISVIVIQGASSQILSLATQRNNFPPVFANLGNGAANIANTAGVNAASIGTNINNLAANGIIRTPNLYNANANNQFLQSGILQAANIQPINSYANANQYAALAGNIGQVVNKVPLAINSPLGNQAFGVQIMADALEVGGQLKAAGRLPIYTTVAVNGKLPTQGTASVNYSCGKLS